ncbi:hypothetical protein [Sphingomonas caseinilyticus]|nr:hypothetical protein [Sphingomonas caseinilyticus]
MTNRSGTSNAVAATRITRAERTSVKPTLSARDPIAYAAAAKALG